MTGWAHAGIVPFAEAVTITALLFPLVRPLYMSSTTPYGGRG